MDELTVLRDHAPTTTAPDPAVLRATRAALVDAARGERLRPVAPLPRRRRPRRRLVVAAATVAAAAAVTVGVLVAPTARIGDREPVARADAAEVLLQAAAVARDEPEVVPRADQYVYAHAEGAGAALWLSVDGTHDGLSVDSDGSREILPGCRGGTALVPGNYEGVRPQPCTPMPAYQPDLPTDATAMFAYLTGVQVADGAADDPSAINRVGKMVEYLLSSTYLTAQQRGALFEAVTRVPGLQVEEGATGPNGERGTAVSWQGPAAGDGSVLLFDPATHRLDAFYTRAPDGTAGGGAGGEPQLVDRAGQLP